MSTPNAIRRGDVLLVDLNPVRGHELNKTRPAVVVQNDMGNRYSSTTIIAPTTTTYREYPFEVFVEAAESPFDRDSSIRLDQIRTVSIEERVEESLGRLGAETMDAVDDGLKLSLGLT